jgi:Uma2 family endonuclease
MATVTPHGSATDFPGITFYPRDESATIVIPPSAGTWEGFRQWALSDDFPERGKVSFVAGEVLVDMSPESIDRHNFIKSEICRVLAGFIRQQKLGKFFIDGVLVSNKRAGVSNEPDALFLSYQTFRSGKVELTPAKDHPSSHKEIVGTIDWAVEIVSPSSVRKDTVLLRKAYYQAGVGEYWLIDALGDEIDFQILVPSEKEYVAVVAEAGWLASPTFGKSFKLERAIDEEGFLEYTLQMQ